MYMYVWMNCRKTCIIWRTCVYVFWNWPRLSLRVLKVFCNYLRISKYTHLIFPRIAHKAPTKWYSSIIDYKVFCKCFATFLQMYGIAVLQYLFLFFINRFTVLFEFLHVYFSAYFLYEKAFMYTVLKCIFTPLKIIASILIYSHF